MKLRPLADYLIVEPDVAESKSPGGLIIPEQAKEKPMTGTIIAVGKGRLLDNGTLVPVALKPGQKILCAKYTGTDLKFDGKEFKIIKETEVLAVVA